ncbi:haloacid dehalogenase [Streptococcus bovimastitidis]|uniref:Haloacid dehalogenase n=1 Tax=Streptococcus bovimastitidis TaxID=1856638 RepID=A0A1L8ML92_9STRE|nr:Cof-type HAD-IIB family hydrolase [Streptococcus bovimastitidis]OJF71532.1 haloacid dehalogenase [Streptococcus bovimastitidis]
MIKLIAIDLDGTLLNSQKEIPLENKKAIKEATEAGIKIVLCTGRPLSGTKPYFEQLDFQEDEFLILNNGCSLHSSSDWQVLHAHSLSFEEVETLYEKSANNPDVYLTLTTPNHYYVVEPKVPELVQEDGDLVFTQVETITLDELKQSQELVLQAMYMGEAEAMDSFEGLFRSELSEHYSLVRSQDYILEALPKGITKASALQELAADLGFGPQEIMAIGDAPNDSEMIAFAGLGVAMGNASESIKVLANRVTKTCDQAGVAYAICHFALKQ